MVSFFLHNDFKAWRNNFVTFLASLHPALYERNIRIYNAGFQATPSAEVEQNKCVGVAMFDVWKRTMDRNNQSG